MHDRASGTGRQPRGARGASVSSGNGETYRQKDGSRAVHGSNSVPAGPASHGCVRVTRADAKHLLRAIGVGTTVHLYGSQQVFSAGSRAAGTSSPAGDTAEPTPTTPSATVSPVASASAAP